MNMITDFIKRAFCDMPFTAFLVVFASMTSLTAALISQYVFDMQPCILCIYQRIPYVFAIAFAILSYGVFRAHGSSSIFFMFCAAVALFIDAGIAGYHAGVEYKWWAGTSECGGNLPAAGASIDDIRAAIMNAPLTKCTEPAWTMFGISMAGYNFFYAGGLATMALFSSIFEYKSSRIGKKELEAAEQSKKKA